MDTDTVKREGKDRMDLELGPQIEEILEEQLVSLEKKFRSQLEEKALYWVEEECRKRLEILRESIREEIQREVESWIEGELKRRMKDFSQKNEGI